MNKKFLEFTKIDLNNEKQRILLNFDEISSFVEAGGSGRFEAEINMKNGNKHFVTETFQMIEKALGV